MRIASPTESSNSCTRRLLLVHRCPLCKWALCVATIAASFQALWAAVLLSARCCACWPRRLTRGGREYNTRAILGKWILIRCFSIHAVGRRHFFSRLAREAYTVRRFA
jgi:hypothetical protein